MRHEDYWSGEGDNDNELAHDFTEANTALAYWHWTLIAVAFLLIAFVIFGADDLLHYLSRRPV